MKVFCQISLLRHEENLNKFYSSKQRPTICQFVLFFNNRATSLPSNCCNNEVSTCLNTHFSQVKSFNINNGIEYLLYFQFCCGGKEKHQEPLEEF